MGWKIVYSWGRANFGGGEYFKHPNAPGFHQGPGSGFRPLQPSVLHVHTTVPDRGFRVIRLRNRMLVTMKERAMTDRPQSLDPPISRNRKPRATLRG